MVLSAMPVGDFDKRLVILTKEIGKISAFVKGARRPNSAFLACSQPFSFGEFTLYAGRSAYNIQAVEITNYFAELRDDFESLFYGMYFCEFADYLTKENNDDKEILKLLYQSLKSLAKKVIPNQLIKSIFELKIISLNGETPQVFECVKCGLQPEGLHSNETISRSYLGYYFSAQSGGILCGACKGQDKTAFMVNTSTLYAMQYIISKEIEKLFTFKVTDEIQKELNRCIKLHIDRYIDHEFKSLEMLKSL
jgi:DNA repair protein RecO (recombination protein O)